jgi:hypothetical protein
MAVPEGPCILLKDIFVSGRHIILQSLYLYKQGQG